MVVFYLIFCFKLTHQLQIGYFSRIHTVQSHTFLFFSGAALTDIPHIFFIHLIFYFSFSLIIELNSSWLISMLINAWDTRASMLSSLLLANIRIWSCFFFLFLVILSNFLVIPVVREKIKVKLALPIPTGARTTLVALTTIKILSM